MLVDAHLHFFPCDAAQHPREWAVARGESHWAQVVARDFPNGIQYWPIEDELLKALDDAAIDTAVLLGWYWQRQETCAEQLAWYFGLKQRHPDRFKIMAPIQPAEGEAVLEYARAALEAGCSGFGEMLPATQGFSIEEDPVWNKLCELCAEHGAPINLHITEAAGHEYAGRVETPLMEYVRLAQRHQKTSFIFAHWGGGLPFYELNPKVRQALKNTYYDTAAGPLLYDKRVWAVVKELAGADRILFGSDYPLRLYPKIKGAATIAPFIAEAKAAGLGEEDLEKILGGNARRLFGL